MGGALASLPSGPLWGTLLKSISMGRFLEKLELILWGTKRESKLGIMLIGTQNIVFQIRTAKVIQKEGKEYTITSKSSYVKNLIPKHNFYNGCVASDVSGGFSAYWFQKLLKNSSFRGWFDGAVGETLPLHAWGPEFGFPWRCWLDMAAYL